MKNKALCVLFCIMLLLMVSACGVKKTTVSGQTTEMVESTQSTQAASSAETTGKKPADDVVNAIDLADWFGNNSSNIVYLKDAVTGAVVDADVTNTIPGEGADETAALPAGTILYPANPDPVDILIFTEDMDFITYQGVRIHINTAISSDGSILFDGKLTTDIFGGAFERIDEVAANYQQTEDVDEIVMKPWEALDPHAFYKKIIIRIDWNQDGMEDEICQTNDDTVSNTLTFTDGKTGNVTDLNALVIVPENENPDTDVDDTVNLKLDSTSLVVQNSKGEYGILSPIYYGDRGCYCYAFRYDSDNLIACKRIGEPYSYQNAQPFSYQDGQLYWHPYTNCLGNLWVMNQAIDLADDFTFTNLSKSEYYGQAPYVTFVVFTKTTVDIDISNGSGYEASTLAPGIVILPDRIETQEDGTTYLYVTLVDGHEGRFAYTADETGYPVYLNGIDQLELFAGMSFGG